MVTHGQDRHLIIAITEVKPKYCRHNPTRAELQIDGYEMYTKNIDTAEGRGIIIYTSSRLITTEFHNTATGNEQLWVKVTLTQGDTLALGCIYKSPNTAHGKTT